MEPFARRLERSGARFVATVRKLLGLLKPLKRRYRPRVTSDGPACVMVHLYGASGTEAALSLTADFDRTDVTIHLLVEGENGDLEVQNVEGTDRVGRGLRKALRHLEGVRPHASKPSGEGGEMYRCIQIERGSFR